MTTELTVTMRGQVTLRKEILRHLGIQPGQKLSLNMFPDGRAELRAARPVVYGGLDDFFSWLEIQPSTGRSREEIDAQIAEERDSWGQ